MLVEEREDPAAPRRRGGVVVRERDLPLGQYDMASTVNTRMEKGTGEKSATKFELTERPKENRESKLRKISTTDCTPGEYNRNDDPVQNVETQQNAVVVFSAQPFDLINPYVWVSFVKKSEVLVTEQAIDVETSDPKS